MAKWTVGDKVTPDPKNDRVHTEARGQVFIVEKVNPKKTIARPQGGGRGLNYPHDFFVEATKANLDAGKRPLTVPFKPREHFTCGQVVTLKKPWHDWDTGTPLVVLADKGKRVNVTLLGGDGDRYLRVAPSELTVRDSAWLLAALEKQDWEWIGQGDDLLGGFR